MALIILCILPASEKIITTTGSSSGGSSKGLPSGPASANGSDPAVGGDPGGPSTARESSCITLSICCPSQKVQS